MRTRRRVDRESGRADGIRSGGNGLADSVGLDQANPTHVTDAEIAGRLELAERILARLQELLSPQHEASPWPIRVQCLGTFKLFRDGIPIKSDGKAQQRVLGLLKAIISLGPEGVGADRLGFALWPSSDGDAAQAALEVTVHRLRKLLGIAGAVVVSDGKIALDTRYCWVDSIAFERALDAAESADGSGGPLVAPAERALHFYKGLFLPDDGDMPWLLPKRERLHSRFLRHVERSANALEERGEFRSAAELCGRALELDPLAEALYRKLIACYGREGRRAEALQVYRRCRHMLSVVLGVQPSPETEAIRSNLLEDRAVSR